MTAKEKNIMRLVDQFKHDQLCIIRNKEPCEYKYSVFRGQCKHVIKMLRKYNVHEDNIILQLPINAGIDLWNKCKETLPIQHEKLHKSTTTYVILILEIWTKMILYKQSKIYMIQDLTNYCNPQIFLS